MYGDEHAHDSQVQLLHEKLQSLKSVRRLVTLYNFIILTKL